MPPGKENSLKKRLSRRCPVLLWIDFRVGSFDVNRAQHAGRAVTRTSHVNHVKVEHFMTRFKCVYIKESAGLVPQCPSMRGLICSGFSFSRSSGLS